MTNPRESIFGWSLPPGVTNSMCEPNNPICGRCGHTYEYHYDNEDIEYDESGLVVHACDYINNKQCSCIGFEEGAYDQEDEPEYEQCLI